MKSTYFSAFFLSVAVLSPCEADVAAQLIVLNCMNCHLDKAEVSETDIPGLSRLLETQLAQALMDFKYDTKQATLMPRIAKGYSDEELAAVAAYIANTMEQ